MNLEQKCIEVLENNWRETFTIPSPRLYPFQWNWDSGFIAIGNLFHKPERSIVEMETLFSGQWENGFLPHILFHNSEKYTSYFPSADYWNSSLSKYAPKKLKTSGITQPPIHGFVLELLLNQNFEKSRIINLYNKIINYHKYLYKYREAEDSGLIEIWHNWESGMDNSPWWDIALAKIDEKEIRNIKLHRKDIHEVEQSDNTRPKDIDYKRYLHLVHQLQKNGFEWISENYPFQILDPLFNSILVASNNSLIKIGKKLNLDTTFIEEKNKITKNNFNKYLWNKEDSLFYPFDLVSNTQIKIHASGSYLPIFAEIPSEQDVKRLVRNWDNDVNLHLIPSCFPNQKGFEARNYWRGPVWINVNWMVWKGLLKYNLHDTANRIKNDTIKLVEENSIYEYFEAINNNKSNSGYGGNNFSWTAALILEMLRNK